MQILYISTSSSERLINQIHQETGCNPGYAMQKFNRLLIKGLIASDVTVSTLSNPPITRSVSSNIYIRLKKEEENSITYRYAPIINLSFFGASRMAAIRQLYVMCLTLVYVLVLCWQPRSIGCRA